MQGVGEEHGVGVTPLEVTFSRQQLARTAADLAAQGVSIDASSGKYPEWFGRLYGRARYEYRGKFAKPGSTGGLAEYAEVFKTVCVDAAYFNFPSGRKGRR